MPAAIGDSPRCRKERERQRVSERREEERETEKCINNDRNLSNKYPKVHDVWFGPNKGRGASWFRVKHPVGRGSSFRASRVKSKYREFESKKGVVGSFIKDGQLKDAS